MEKMTLAFDIEGTLLDKEGKLYPQVLDIFRKADLSKTNFIFITGANYRIALNTVKQINDNLSMEIKPWIVANCGAQIYDCDNHLLVNKSLEKETVKNIVDTAIKADNKSIFMYATKDENFIESQVNGFASKNENADKNAKDSTLINKINVNNIAVGVFKRHDEKKGACSMNLKEIQGVRSGRNIDDVLTEIGDVNQLYVISLNKNKRKSIIDNLQALLGQDGTVYPGKYIEIPASTKFKALQWIVENGKDMPKSVEDVVYFGEGLNDVECLQKCKVSVARGENAVEEAKKVAKFRLDDLSIFADNLYKGEYSKLPATIQR